MNHVMNFLLSMIMLVIASVTAAGADNMKAFPPAEAGMTRYVLPLPPEKDEDSLKVELVVGKMVKTDAGNRYFFAGTNKRLRNFRKHTPSSSN